VMDISVIILTYNEELHIERCIKNLLPIASQIFIVDSFSTDNTVSLAEALGAIVVQRPWKNYADQFQWGLDNLPIETEWIMRMDADEYLEPDLVSEICDKVPRLPGGVGGICLKRKHHFLGRWIKFGDRYPLVLLRIWRNKQAHIENRWMDEHIVLDSGISITFDSDFVDDNLNSVGWFINKHNNYATREMIDILNQKHNLFAQDKSIEDAESGQAKLKRFVKNGLYNRLPLFFRPILYFFYRYFFRLGFLDGKEGFSYHFMQGLWYRCLVDLKCMEAEILMNGLTSNNQKIACLEKLTGLSLK
jgi:glycosyltransferase involved in cell wall biosynthesis